MNSLQLGKLEFLPVQQHLELVGETVKQTLSAILLAQSLDEIFVSPIDDSLADTAQFCEAYDISPEISANTIVVEAKRSAQRWHAICNVLATTRADINKVVRKHLDAKAASFASMEFAVNETKMEYGGIGPIGAPNTWPLLIDSRVLEPDYVVIGSGFRRSKIAIPGRVLAQLPTAQVISDMAVPIER